MRLKNCSVREVMETWKEQRPKVVGKMVLSTGGNVKIWKKEKKSCCLVLDNLSAPQSQGLPVQEELHL